MEHTCYIWIRNRKFWGKPWTDFVLHQDFPWQTVLQSSSLFTIWFSILIIYHFLILVIEINKACQIKIQKKNLKKNGKKQNEKKWKRVHINLTSRKDTSKTKNLKKQKNKSSKNYSIFTFDFNLQYILRAF